MARTHRNSYDHAIRLAGATIVDIGHNDRGTGAGVRGLEPWEIEAAIDANTAAFLFVATSETLADLPAVLDTVHHHGLPVIVDADTGFGNALNVQRTVLAFERAGAAMIQLEDQGFPKRCGHLDGKTVVPTREMQGKLRAALDARRSPHTLILARTDAVAVEGFEAAMDRAEAYLECGVDALFIEAVRSPEQMDLACGRFAQRIPMLANMVEGGKKPVTERA